MAMSKPSFSGPEVGLLLYPGSQMAMVYGLSDLLAVASTFSGDHGGPALRVSHWRLDEAGEVVRVHDTHPDGTGGPEVLVVPGRLSPPVSAEEAQPFAKFLRDNHDGGAILASSCNGAFLLAHAGLLDGRPATTHWQFADAFQSRFPGVRLDVDRMVIDDGEIVTAGGLMAWTDLGIRLVERLLGPVVMMETARFLLLDPAGREQKFYSKFMPRLTHGDAAILKVQHWLQARSARAVSIPQMAAEAGLEERTFLRRFKAATGLKPTEYAQHLRIAKARELLEFTRQAVDQIAWAVGYEDPAAFRRVFHRMTGLSAGEYRGRFSATAREQALAEA